MANESAADVPMSTWRDQAVARSLDSARVRAENRVQRFLDAAMDLMSESPSGKEFTVQEVVERSGQSLRSFYQYFGGKQELLLALFEETVRSTAEHLYERISRDDEPVDRLHDFVVEVLPAVPAGTEREDHTQGCATGLGRVCSAPAHRAADRGSTGVWAAGFPLRGDPGRGGGSWRYPRRPQSPEDRRRCARGDHVQCVLEDHRWALSGPGRWRSSRGALGSHLPWDAEQLGVLILA